MNKKAIKNLIFWLRSIVLDGLHEREVLRSKGLSVSEEYNYDLNWVYVTFKKIASLLKNKPCHSTK